MLANVKQQQQVEDDANETNALQMQLKCRCDAITSAWCSRWSHYPHLTASYNLFGTFSRQY
jgi:hypothetical protein